MLTSRYGKASKGDLMECAKIIKKVKRETTEFLIPNIGDIKDWVLVGIKVKCSELAPWKFHQELEKIESV